MAASTSFLDVKSGSDFATNYCLVTFPGRTSTSSKTFKTCRVVCKTESRRSTLRFGTRKLISKTEDSGDDQENGAFNLGTQLLTKLSGKSNENFKLTTTTSKLAGVKKDLSLSLGLLRRSPDVKTVFVAGATGQIGARISQQLLRSGFSVRGGVRDLFFAQQLAEFATQYGVISREEARKINAVEFEFGDVESIAKAIGNAGRVVVTVGPTEDGPKDRVTAADALQVVEAAGLANVSHVVIVAETGGGSDNGPLGLISDFFSKLFSKDAEVTTDSLLDSLVDTDLRFTFVKVGSTEGVDDISPEGESVVLLSEGTYKQGTSKVSKSQLASVVAGIFSNVSLAENKVLEVATINSTSPKPIEELLSSIPVDGRRAALAEARAKVEAEEKERQIKEQAEAEARRAIEEAQEAAELANQLEAEAKKLATEEAKATINAQKAKDKAKAAAASLEGLGAKVKEFGVSLTEQDGGFGNFFKRGSTSTIGEGSSSETDVPEEEPAAEPQGLKLNFGFLKRAPPTSFSSSSTEPSSVETPVKKTSSPAVVKPRSSPPNVSKPKEKKKSQQKVLGGLFKQETFYVDD